MTTVAVGAVKGAPGATTTVLAMAAIWPRGRRLLVTELDPDGGVLAARRGLAAEPGLVDAAAAVLRGREDVGAHAQPLGDRVAAIVAPVAVEQIHATLAAAGDALWSALAGADGVDVLLDCGRLSATSPVIGAAAAADVALLTARPRLDDVALLRGNVPALRRAGVDPHLVLIDDGPYRAEDVATAADAPVAAVLPEDRRAAAALNGDAPWHRLSRSRLLRAARGLVEDVAGDATANESGTAGQTTVAR